MSPNTSPPPATSLVRVARLFEFYTRTVWPLHRLSVRARLARRCRRCAISERAVPLDDAPLCEACRTYRPSVNDPVRAANESKTLATLLSEYQGRGRQSYDALLLFSGGKDSLYMARRMRDEHPGLRLLAFTMDNTFMSPVARANVAQLVHRLDLDHVTHRPSREFMKKLFRYGLTHLNAGGGYGTVDFSDGELLLDTARSLAAQKEIPLILCGYSRLQVQSGLGLDGFESPAEQERRDRTHVAGMALSDVFSEGEQRRWWKGSRWPAERVARLLFPLHAWDRDESEITRQVADWGLLQPRENSPLVTNHQLIPLLGVVDVHRMGYSGFEPEFCRMIREGKAPLKRWRAVFEFLEHTARTGLFLKPQILDILAQLELSPEEVGIHFPGGNE